jgi:beta-xylosidase
MGTGAENGVEKGEPVPVHRKPEVGIAPGALTPSAPATSDEFDSPTLGLQWQWQANPRAGFASLTARPGSLRLACVPAPAAASLYDAPNLLLQKFPAPAFTATAVLDFSGAARPGDQAGLIVFGYSYAWIGLRRESSGLRLVQVLNMDANKSGVERVTAALEFKTARVFLRVTVAADAACRFAYSLDGIAFTPLGESQQATVARWVGAKVGLFASGAPGTASPGQADFERFHLTP